MEPRLILADPPEGFQGLVYPIPEGMTRVGRSSKSDLRLRDTTVSRSHCYVERSGADVRLYDLGSQNGTWVGNVGANGGALNDGDVVLVGRFKLLFRQGATVPAAGPVFAPGAAAPSPISAPAAVSAPVNQAAGAQAAGAQAAGTQAAGAQAAGAQVVGAEAAQAPVPSAANADRPRVRRRPVQVKRSSNTEMVVLIVSLIAGLGFAVWAMKRDDDSRSVTSKPQPSGMSALQRQLDVTRAELESRKQAFQKLNDRFVSSRQSEEQLRADATGQLEDLMAEIATLEARERRLARQERDEEDAIPARQPRDVTDELLASVEREDDEAEDRWDHDNPTTIVESLHDDQESETEPVPEVANVANGQYVERDKKDISGIVDQLMVAIESYAAPTTTPERLEPYLGQLRGTGGDAAAMGLCASYHHARDLLKEVDQNLEFLHKRNKALEAEAEALKERSKRKTKREGSGYGGAVPEEYRKKQMVLELSYRKIGIKQEQRERLLALHDKMLEALATRTDVSSTRRLAHHFVQEKGTPERLAILEGLANARDPSVVPIIAAKLSTRDEVIANAVVKTLRRITGDDHGKSRRGWDRWWHDNKPSAE